MIPKRIHYCWFGGNPLPELAIKCIESWKKYCPEYEIIEWNEKNFDLNCNRYVSEAYKCKKWAFVTDYVRLYAMVTQGGIYMDTDVEVLKNLDIFLEKRAFSGFETEKSIPTGIMACEKDFPLFKELLDEYKERAFIKENGEMDLTTNVTAITNTCLKHGLSLNNQLQQISDFTLYPKEFFCPKNYETGKIECTKNTYTIHHFSGSWHTEKEKKFEEYERKLLNKYGQQKTNLLVKNILYRFIKNLYINGLKKTIKKIKEKI